MPVTRLAQCVTLCGRSGTRPWPLSRAVFPNKFLCLARDDGLFQQEAERLAALGADDVASAAPRIVSNEEHRFLVLEQLRGGGIEPGVALMEPPGRNAAPALTLAALAALESGNDLILVVTPADQTVTDQPAFTRPLQQASREAAGGAIVILGIAPDRPETGYGYIKTAVPPKYIVPPALTFMAERFVEKPDVDTTQRYVDEVGYYSNAGTFVLKTSVCFTAIECFRADIAQATRTAWRRKVARTTNLSGRAKPSSPPYPPNPSTTPRWGSDPAVNYRSRWCHLPPAGATSAHRTPSGISWPRITPATSISAMSSPSTAAISAVRPVRGRQVWDIPQSEGSSTT